MKYSLKTIEIISLVSACILGFLFHFIYTWTGENPVAGIFFPVNESTWEHLKLIFFPILLVSAVEYFILGFRYENFICTKFLSVLLGMACTVILFFTYTGIYGKNSDVMNLLIYFISMIAAYFFSLRMLRRQKLSGFITARFCYLGFMALTLLFFLFTLFPPQIGLFTPPV